MLTLHVTPADGDPFHRDLDRDEVVVGRSTSADLTVADRYLSRRHARFVHTAEGWVVEDLGSRNGTFLNGRRIDSSAPVTVGDVVSVSASILRILEHGTEAALGEPHTGSSGSLFRRASDLVDSSSRFPDPDRATDPEQMRRHAERLAILNDVHRTLATSITRDDLLDTILDRVFNHLQPEQAAIFLKGRDGSLERVAGRTIAADDDFVVSQKLSAEVVERGMAALVHDVEVDRRFADAQSLIAAGIRSLLAAPLFDPAGTLGMIVLGSSAGVRVFNEDDMELLSSLASVAALRIRNLALAEEVAERRRLDREVALARVIQNALIPDQLPTIPGYELYGANLPSQGVSGDYFEVSERREGSECALLIADVSGKGIAASLLTAYLEALTATAIENGLAPEQVFIQVSTRLFRRTPPERFATALLVIVESATGRLCYANAGHNPALLLRADGAVEYLEGTGAPLGMLSVAEYHGAELDLGPGDTLVLYTDGYTEAVDPADDEFGIERLESLCRAHSNLALVDLAGTLNDELDRFVSGVPFADDRTLVMLRRSP